MTNDISATKTLEIIFQNFKKYFLMKAVTNFYNNNTGTNNNNNITILILRDLVLLIIK